MTKGITILPILRFTKNKVLVTEIDQTAIEMPVALIYNGISHAIMMTSPVDLELFALGFSLSENIIRSPADLYGMDIVSVQNGIEVRMEVSSRCFTKLKEHRRALVGRTGCGLCGSEHLAIMDRLSTPVPFTQWIALETIMESMRTLTQVQTIGRSTGCTHAAIWISPEGTIQGGFEDVARHVALDKVLGFRAQRSNQSGAILISSRASYEMVQKAVQCGVEILCAVSAPTALAIEKAEQANLTLLGFCRGEQGIIYTHALRVLCADISV